METRDRLRVERGLLRDERAMELALRFVVKNECTIESNDDQNDWKTKETLGSRVLLASICIRYLISVLLDRTKSDGSHSQVYWSVEKFLLLLLLFFRSRWSRFA